MRPPSTKERRQTNTFCESLTQSLSAAAPLALCDMSATDDFGSSLALVPVVSGGFTIGASWTVTIADFDQTLQLHARSINEKCLPSRSAGPFLNEGLYPNRFRKLGSITRKVSKCEGAHSRITTVRDGHYVMRVLRVYAAFGFNGVNLHAFRVTCLSSQFRRI